MTEDEARAWVLARWGSDAVTKLSRFADMVVEENRRQNLISAGSIPALWTRHIIDSAQLLILAEDRDGLWIDVGTGGGFPGVVIATLRRGEVMLVEPRKRRADFLTNSVATLGLSNAAVVAERIERVARKATFVSARAVASPAKLFAAVKNVTSMDTRFLLPSGRDAELALMEAKRQWQGVFHVEQSITSSDSRIIVACNVEPR